MNMSTWFHHSLLVIFLSLQVLTKEAVAYEGTRPGINKNADLYTDTHAAVKLSSKQLYFFAGPHKSASTSVEKFFHRWAAGGHSSSHPHTIPLQYWRWPDIDEDEGYKEYGSLVTDPSSQMDQALSIIQQKFDESDNGVFLGTEEFDQIGSDAIYNAMPVMDAIVDKLGVKNRNIKVIINYRAPRLDQWISMWKHAEDEYEDSSYEVFICDAHNKEEDKKLRYSMIGAEMNPLNAALAFLRKGWKVTLMDMGGVEKAGKDIVHTIGCDVLLGGCDDGIMGSLQDYLPMTNAVDKEFNELSDEESDKIEKLFRYRDCGYQTLLAKYVNTGQMEILYQDSLWSECYADPSYYKKFIDNTPIMYNALLGQLECEDNPHDLIVGADMDAALAGGGRFAGGAFNIIFFPLVLLAAIGYGICHVQKRKRQQQQQIIDGGTEMASYPSEGFKDEHNDDEQDNGGGGFRDDDELEDEEELSDQNPNPIT
jgi:hypothetical protein